MLSRLAIESAAELNKILKERGKVIVPNDDTQVEKLVDATEPVKDQKFESEIDVVEALEESTVVPMELSPVTHDNVMENVSERTAALINRRLSLIKDIVNPLVHDYTAKIQTGLIDTVKTDPEIKPIELGDFYRNPVVENIFSVHRKDGLEPVSTLKGFDSEVTDFSNVLTTGSEYVDNKLNSFMEIYGPEFVKDVYNAYFVRGDEFVVPKSGINENYIRKVDEAVVAYFLARKFYNEDEIQSSAYTTDDQEYRSKLMGIMNRAAQIVQGAFASQQGWETSGALVGERSNESIAVFKANYKTFLENGGSKYAIYGHVKKGGYRTADAILQNKTALEDVYQADVETQIRITRGSKLENIRQLALRNLPLIIDTIPEDVINSISSFNGDSAVQRQILNKRGIEFVNNQLKINEDDIEGVALDIITLGLLPELRLRDFYAKMDGYLKPDSDNVMMSPAKAVYYVVLEELADFFLSQVSTSTVKQ